MSWSFDAEDHYQDSPEWITPIDRANLRARSSGSGPFGSARSRPRPRYWSGGTIDSTNGANIMKAIELDVLPAWVHEDGLLFILDKVWPQKRVDEANHALARHGYDERLKRTDMPLSRQHTVLWVDPAYLAAERWPESSVSLIEVQGWQKVFRVDITDLPVPVPASAHAANGGAR